jgi:hypothetical protein
MYTIDCIYYNASEIRSNYSEQMEIFSGEDKIDVSKTTVPFYPTFELTFLRLNG